jgi:hypothetical protein
MTVAGQTGRAWLGRLRGRGSERARLRLLGAFRLAPDSPSSPISRFYVPEFRSGNSGSQFEPMRTKWPVSANRRALIFWAIKQISIRARKRPDARRTNDMGGPCHREAPRNGPFRLGVILGRIARHAAPTENHDRGNVRVQAAFRQCLVEPSAFVPVAPPIKPRRTPT